MYKRASRAMLHAHRVDAPLPTGGYIGTSQAIEDDFIPSAGNMSREECEAERRQILLEIAKAQNELVLAKRSNLTAAAVDLGHRLQGYGARIGLLRRRIHELSQAAENEATWQAIRELLDDETIARIVARKSELICR